jgi:hypothetical protein
MKDYGYAGMQSHHSFVPEVIHLKFCQFHENSGCLFVLGFGTRKIFSKYGSS